jgi:hypothetical protein
MLHDFVKGFISVITVTAAPQLYRYPYRSSAEALRGDMQRVGRDMQSTFDKLAQETQDTDDEQ